MMMHRVMKVTLPAVVVATATVASGCATLSNLNNKEKGGAIGATTGAAIGAVIGNNTGSTARGAIIGAAVGGAAGVIIGNQMDQKAKQIQQSVPGAVVSRVGEGLVVTFNSGLLFDTDSDVLRSASQENLTNLANNLSSFGDSKLLLVGHTDATGTETYNQALSERRAAAVAGFLESHGVSGARVATQGKGEAEPVATNETDAGRQQNRRVEIAVYASDKMKADAKAQAAPQH